MKYLLLALLLVSAPAHAVSVRDINADNVKAWLIEDHTLPIISVQLTFQQAGSITDGDAHGRAYLASLSLTEGAGQYDARAFNEELDYYAIRLGVSAGRDNVSVSMDVLSEHADKAFALLGTMLTKPHFDEDDGQRIKAEHLSNLARLQERPSYLVSRAFYGAALAGHAYVNSPYGAIESIPAITSDALRDFTKSYLAKDNLVISVSGDIKADALEALLQKHLGDLPEKAQPVNVEHQDVAFADEAVTVQKTLPQTSIKIAYPGIARQHEDFYAAYVMNHILGGSGLAARLGQAIRQERGLTYSVGSSLNMPEHSEWLSIDFSTKSDSTAEAVQVAKDVVAKAAAEGVTQEELDAAISNITGQFPLNMDSNNERASYLTSMQINNLGKDYLDKRNAIMAQVQLKLVNKVLKELLGAGKQLTILVGDMNE